MSWQNPDQPDSGQPLMKPPGPGASLPYPNVLPTKPGDPLAPPGAELAPPGYPNSQAPPYAPPGAAYVPPGAPYASPGAPYAPPGAPYVPPGAPYAPPGAPYAQPGDPYAQQGPQAAPPGGWPMPNSNCPTGLEYLSALDTLIVHQKVELLEVFTGWETENKYVVQDLRAQPIFYATEESDTCSRQCCGSARAFEMRIADSSMREVIRLKRGLNCGSCLCPCCLQLLEVFSNGVKIGSVEQNWHILPSFSICDATGDTVLKIKGPFCTTSCCGSDVDFNVFSANGEYSVGRISKKWSGFEREYLTDADTFGITFPRDLDVKIKAVLLGACFLIDFMYFENTQQKR